MRSVIAIVSLATAALSAQAIRNVSRITIDELKPLLATRAVVVLDVRRPDEFAEGHIPGAVNLDYTLVSAQGSRFKGETRPIVAYCACANEMTAALKGGWDEWKARGEPIEK
jgi:rhodanese-related sulfurtransferase